jgi:hypothetical protein
VVGGVAVKCIGYGPWKGTCTNVAGTNWTPHWCPRCDELRRAMITLRLHAMRDNAPDPRMPTTEEQAQAVIAQAEGERP